MNEPNLIGTTIGNYCITTAINSGAYGSVYQAQHTHLRGRVVAIKLLHTYMGSNAEREQFLQEAQFLAELEHPHILHILDFGFHNGQPYLIATYAAGGSLRARLKRGTPLPFADALHILQQVGQALDFAHQRNVIHRDLKPENILFNAQGNALLADFGIATLLSTASIKLTTVIGTPSYMAPEQFKGEISKQGDQYALACLAYELLTGRPPFTAPDFISMGFKHATEQPIALRQFNPQLPAPTEAAILKALSKLRADRYPDIPSFVVALWAPLMQATIPPSTSPPTPVMPTQLATRKVTQFVAQTFSAPTKEQYIDLGNEYSDAGHYQEALDAYEQAIHLDPNDPSAYNGKGFVLTELKRYNEALIACEHAIRLAPNDAAAYNNKGFVLNELKRYNEALAALEHATRLDPNDAAAYNNKGNTLSDLKRYNEALLAYELAIHLNPNDASAYHNKSDVLEKLGRKREAREVRKQAQQLEGM